MALKRRKIVTEMLDIGTGTVSVPADGGGSMTGTQLNITSLNVSGIPGFYYGTGSPEAAVTAAMGSLYLRTDGGASTTLYVKTSGAGSTGWTAK